jgi:hypothetical protein
MARHNNSCRPFLNFKILANAGWEYMVTIGSTPISPPFKTYAARVCGKALVAMRQSKKLSPILSPNSNLQSFRFQVSGFRFKAHAPI